MRVACEETYRFYRSVIARAIEDHQPHLQVRWVNLEGIQEELAGWVELPVEPSHTGEVCLDGDYEGILIPHFGKVLSALDEAEEMLRRGALAESFELGPRFREYSTMSTWPGE